ncbi:hypothetical protein MRX96_016186 [Rhipicephalus microplus]
MKKEYARRPQPALPKKNPSLFFRGGLSAAPCHRFITYREGGRGAVFQKALKYSGRFRLFTTYRKATDNISAEGTVNAKKTPFKTWSIHLVRCRF